MFAPVTTWSTPRRQPTTLGEAEPGQRVWLGEYWTTVYDRQVCEDRPGWVEVLHQTDGGQILITPHRTGRQVSRQLRSGLHEKAEDVCPVLVGSAAAEGCPGS
ncbi:hypothetical protein [Actinomadura kijaniata]|uniref:hypothetical protein n=1 Tax=Actinomadura kijaniata TaxID=46161 RepID=UPI0008300C1F|nr:hypothetical protein [Actinomadura kijaniata]